jgi:hypothetical protein
VSVALRGELGGWRSRTTFVLALSASAVGLGNLWRFSYLVGENGGGLFVLAYLFCLFFVAMPVMVAEVIIGSHGRGSPVEALRWAADRSLLSRGWMLLGVLACVTGLLILSYYVVVAGWALAYAWYSHAGWFAAASAPVVAEHFRLLLDDVLLMIYWQTLFLLPAVGVVALGIRRGLGLLVWLTVPCLFALLAALVQFGFDAGDIPATQEFLFSIKPIDFSWNSMLAALGQALFTLGVGVGTGISYGAYAPSRLPIGRSVMAVGVFDTAIALMAGLAIFPIVFANNMEPSMGPGLMFVTVAEQHRLDKCGGAVVQRSVGDLGSGELADQSLELEDRLQRALGYLGLVWGVGGKELAPGQDCVDHRRLQMPVGTGSQEEWAVIGRDIDGRHLLEVSKNRGLVSRWRQLQPVDADLGWYCRKKLVDGVKPDLVQNRAPIVGTRADPGVHQWLSSSSSAS